MAVGISKETSLVVSESLRLSRWTVQAAIGAYEHEKKGTQELILDLRLWGDFRTAANLDSLEAALDYAALRTELEAWIEGRRWNLLEAFADQFCRRVLQLKLLTAVELTVEKPAALAPVMVSYTLTVKK